MHKLLHQTRFCPVVNAVPLGSGTFLPPHENVSREVSSQVAKFSEAANEGLLREEERRKEKRKGTL